MLKIMLKKDYYFSHLPLMASVYTGVTLCIKQFDVHRMQEDKTTWFMPSGN